MRKKHCFGTMTYIEPNTLATIRFYLNTNVTIVTFMGNNYEISGEEMSSIAWRVLSRPGRKTRDYYKFAEQVRNEMLLEIVSKWIDR